MWRLTGQSQIRVREGGYGFGPMLYSLRSFRHNASVNAVFPEPTGLDRFSEPSTNKYNVLN